jgi:hypothetical protein|uniref:Uncharacterized protein n=1 Tax=viral metagenome TaxID=1070528 RepID=A0A6C0L9U8_9ZZZZ
MNISIKLFLLLINVVGVYSYNTPLFKFNNNNSNNKGGSNICVLNYNNVYSSFYKWSNENKESSQKIIEDTLWLSKYRFVNPSIVIGVYNDTFNLNYICLLRRLSSTNYKLLNIFANPSNNFDDDLQLLKNLFEFAINNDIKLNTDKLTEIDKSRYLLTYLFYYSQINSKTI